MQLLLPLLCSAGYSPSALMADGFLDGYRYDLDDVNGEVVLVQFGHSDDGLSCDGHATEAMQCGADGEGRVLLSRFLDGDRSLPPFIDSCTRFGGNPFILPLPPLNMSDPVGHDISEIPIVISKIQEDWNK